MQIRLGERQFTVIRLEGLERLRAEGLFQQAPKWACNDSSIVAIAPSEDGLSCRVEAVSFGRTLVNVTDRDDARVPAVIFGITVTSDRIINLGCTVEPVQDVGAEAERPPEPPHTPLPEGAVQHDPNTHAIRRETDADTGDSPVTSMSDIEEQPAPPAQPEQPVL
jgi:hypothetical protein